MFNNLWLKLRLLCGLPIPEAALPRFFLYQAIFSPHLIEGREDFGGWRAVSEFESLDGTLRKFVADKLFACATSVKEYLYAGEYAEGKRHTEKGDDFPRAMRAFTKARQLATAPNASFEDFTLLVTFLDVLGYYDARKEVLADLVDEMLSRPLTPEQSALLWPACIGMGNHQHATAIEAGLAGITADQASWQRALALAPSFATKFRAACQHKLAA